MNTNGSKPSAFRNWLSLCGMLLAIASFFSFLLLFAIDSFAHDGNPYLGILTFVVAPGFLIFGLFLIFLGWLLQKRRLAKGGEAEPLVSIDLSRPEDRRKMFVFGAAAAIFLLFSAVGSYRTYHFAESVQFCGQTCHTPMNPEFTTYQNSPHARVACTECHVGSGALPFIKAKLNGVHQMIATVQNSFDRPIKTPKHLRGADEICEQCHWSKTYIGNLQRTYSHFLSDETNTAYTVQMLLKVGGGDPSRGPVGGIHWHMNLANKVEYITTNDQRQVIPWVRLTAADGTVTEYRTPDFKDETAQHEIHRMDCMDCHNRPAHQFKAPNVAVDVAMSLGRIDPAIPLIRSNVVFALMQTNASEAEGLKKIETHLKAAYKSEARIDKVIAEAQQIYSKNFFPEMKTDWRSHPDNIGHKFAPGCFRCHDGRHKTADGKKAIAASNCNDCHLIIAQGSGADLTKLSGTGHKFAHPDASTEATDPDCATCHTGGL